MNASIFRTDTFVDFFDTERYSIAPSLTWLISKNTQLTLEAEYSEQRQPNDRGLPAVGTVLPNPNGKIPINRFIGEPFSEIDKNNRRPLRIGYNFEHRFNEKRTACFSRRTAYCKIYIGLAILIADVNSNFCRWALLNFSQALILCYGQCPLYGYIHSPGIALGQFHLQSYY
ncbi:hypothetical protein [Chlorogloeopsis fritschii]|uniref:hypothetical protein n=1 Tax=Chlorogloeopsis fritschii TaxID=1124 RepID=UPI0023F9CF07|nr:hypothetical protein [Chlorogloeopsis fritschii]